MLPQGVSLEVEPDSEVLETGPGLRQASRTSHHPGLRKNVGCYATQTVQHKEVLRAWGEGPNQERFPKEGPSRQETAGQAPASGATRLHLPPPHPLSPVGGGTPAGLGSKGLAGHQGATESRIRLGST